MPMMRIVIQEDEQEALFELAKTECRDPRSQAVFLIRQGLQKCGLLPNQDEHIAPNNQEQQDDHNH